MPGPLYDLVQRHPGLCTTSYKGPKTVVRPRTKVPRPLHDLVQSSPDLCATSHKGLGSFVRGRAK
eukprot:15328381-Alexandrium_andersonii.AAC.1